MATRAPTQRPRARPQRGASNELDVSLSFCQRGIHILCMLAMQGGRRDGEIVELRVGDATP
jgi:hypothetical protein